MEFAESSSAPIPEINFSLLPPTQKGVDRVHWVEYRPSGQVLENNPIDFIIPGNGADYIDLKRSYLHTKFQVLKADGTEVGADDHVSVINLIHHTMWSQIDTFLNQQLVSSSTNNYGYKAYLDTLLHNDKQVKDTRLQSHLWYGDTAGAMDAANPLTGGNSGLAYRYALVGANKQAHTYGPLLTDLAQMDKWIMNGIDVHIRLWPAKNTFTLMKEDTITGDFKIKISSIVLQACKITLKPDVLTAQNGMKSLAIYPYKRSRIQTFSIPTGSYLFREDNLFQFDKPSQLIVGFVSSNAYQGSYTKNPFNFVHEKINQIALYVNDVSLPGQPMKLNFDKGDYLEAYNSLFKSFGIDTQDKGNNIDVDDYQKG